MSTRDGDGRAHRTDWPHTIKACVDLAQAASEGHLLADAATIDAALTERGWTWGRRGGQWNPPPDLDASGITSLTPPSVEVILNDPDDALLADVAEQIADQLEVLLGTPESRGPVPGTDQQVDAVWQRPDLSVVVGFLPSTSDQTGSAPGFAPQGHLWLALSRPDITDAEEDTDRARHLARHGSPTERWHLAGQAVLPEDVIALLEGDENTAVVRAVRVGAHRREVMATQVP